MNLIIILIAQYLFWVSIAIFVLYLGYLWKNKTAKLFSLVTLTVISFPLTYIIAKISGYFINDPRPFVVEHIKPLIPHAADNGFPSDHMLLTMALASVVFVYNRKLGITLTIVALCVGTARILAHIHHVEDILGSAVIAICATFAVYATSKSQKMAR
ncbi:MAG TPA: phosphatase PAP2 family protein [Patescibacteria group bacterium]|nr:phosphatase PAP2 family protein [Patescibacteria group bacterium]